MTIDDVALDNTSATNGIYLNGASGASISNSSIAGSNVGVKFTSSASGHLYQNVIDDASIAVDVDYYSIAHLQSTASFSGGENELGNSGSGYITLRSQHSATVYAGDTTYSGDNQFCSGNESDADASTSSSIVAKYNYWPGALPDVSGNVTAYPYYGTASSCSGVSKGFTAGGALPADEVSINSELSASINLMFAAAANQDGAAFAEAAAQLKEIRSEHSGSAVAHAALVGLLQLSRLAGGPSQRAYLDGLARSAGPDQATALGLLVQDYRGAGELVSARSTAALLAELFPDQWHAFYAGLNIFEIDMETADFSTAADVLSKLVPLTDSDRENLDTAWGELIRRSNGTIQRSDRRTLFSRETDAPSPGVLSEVRAYPNPFNPSTVISFEVATRVQVEVAVYDAVGRQMALLANETFAPGRHTATWNASGVPSGTYFAVTRAGDQVNTIPITLVK